MDYVQVKTQAELDRVPDGDVPVIVGNGRFELRFSRPVKVEGSSAPRIVTRGSSAPTIVTRGSSAPTIVTRESSAPRIETWESSAPTIVTWESSAPRIVTWESSAPTIETWESSAPRIVTWGSSAPRIVTRGSSAPTIVTRGSSAPTIETRESSAPRIETRGSSAPRIVTRGSSAPRIVTRGSSAPTIETWGSSALAGRVGKFSLVGVIRHGNSTVNLPGAVLLKALEDVETPEEWFEYHGCEVKRGRATVYKLVGDHWRSGYGTLYEPGKEAKCDDWERTEACGNGLHFSPSASATERYAGGTHYLACSVRVKDVVLLGDKLKAPSCKVLYEVDRFGDRLEATSK